jgi:hypothetical protein
LSISSNSTIFSFPSFSTSFTSCSSSASSAFY